MPAKKVKNKNSSQGSDSRRYLVLVSSLVVLVLIILVFYVQTGKYISRSQSQQSEDDAYMLESVNYHTHQAPPGLPKNLLIGKSDGFVSSQEFKDSQGSALKFVSFRSSFTSANLLTYYKNYLNDRLYLQTENSDGKDIFSVLGQRAGMSLAFNVQPLPTGSLVAIYYWTAK